MLELTRALGGASLRTVYQPIVRIADRVPVALEVLVRKIDPLLGTVQPDQFVPQVESAGLSRSLTKAVITLAFADYALHLAPLGLTVALNFPLDVLMHPESLDWLEARRKQAGIAVDHIAIELTESLPVAALSQADRARLRLAIGHVRRLGYDLAIDDVSPEMPDYRALLAMRFTSMKLDKKAVIEAAHDVDARAFLCRTVAAGKAAGLKIVAEGIEDPATWERVRALGVDEAQGFLVARPLAAEAVNSWLAHWRCPTADVMEALG